MESGWKAGRIRERLLLSGYLKISQKEYEIEIKKAYMTNNKAHIFCGQYFVE